MKLIDKSPKKIKIFNLFSRHAGANSGSEGGKWQQPKRRLQKNNRFSWSKHQPRTCITLFSTFLWRPLHDYDVKPPNLTLYGGRGHTTTNFPSSLWAWIKSLRIQLQEKSPAFDLLNRSKQTRLSLKERKFIFLTTVSLPSSSSLLKVPILITRRHVERS